LKRIVCDTGPLLHLQEADSLDLVKVAGTVAIHLLHSEAEKSLDALSHSSLWISSRILEEVRTALRQIFS
jgi:hypothetical protein